MLAPPCVIIQDLETSMGISVIFLLYIFPFALMAASSDQWSLTWGGGDQNMQLKPCDSIIVGNSKHGMLHLPIT